MVRGDTPNGIVELPTCKEMKNTTVLDLLALGVLSPCTSFCNNYCESNILNFGRYCSTSNTKYQLVHIGQENVVHLSKIFTLLYLVFHNSVFLLFCLCFVFVFFVFLALGNLTHGCIIFVKYH